MAIDPTELTVVIKAFERPACLHRLLQSLRQYYPQLPVIVCDDSKQPSPQIDVQYVRLPYDVGISAGRNEGLRRVQTPYFLLLDDDMELDEKSKIEQLLSVVKQNDDICIAAAAKRKPGDTRLFGWHGYHEVEGADWRQVQGTLEHGRGFDVCNYVENCFVGDTRVIRDFGGWDADLKTHEHAEFFVRFTKAGLKAAYLPSVVIVEHNERPANYRKFRSRDFHFHQGLRKHGIRSYYHAVGKLQKIAGYE